MRQSGRRTHSKTVCSNDLAEGSALASAGGRLPSPWLPLLTCTRPWACAVVPCRRGASGPDPVSGFGSEPSLLLGLVSYGKVEAGPPPASAEFWGASDAGLAAVGSPPLTAARVCMARRRPSGAVMGGGDAAQRGMR
jgi:hypothetical protein